MAQQLPPQPLPAGDRRGDRVVPADRLTRLTPGRALGLPPASRIGQARLAPRPRDRAGLLQRVPPHPLLDQGIAGRAQRRRPPARELRVAVLGVCPPPHVGLRGQQASLQVRVPHVVIGLDADLGADQPEDRLHVLGPPGVLGQALREHRVRAAVQPPVVRPHQLDEAAGDGALRQQVPDQVVPRDVEVDVGEPRVPQHPVDHTEVLRRHRRVLAHPQVRQRDPGLRVLGQQVQQRHPEALVRGRLPHPRVRQDPGQPEVVVQHHQEAELLGGGEQLTQVRVVDVESTLPVGREQPVRGPALTGRDQPGADVVDVGHQRLHQVGRDPAGIGPVPGQDLHQARGQDGRDLCAVRALQCAPQQPRRGDQPLDLRHPLRVDRPDPLLRQHRADDLLGDRRLPDHRDLVGVERRQQPQVVLRTRDVHPGAHRAHHRPPPQVRGEGAHRVEQQDVLQLARHLQHRRVVEQGRPQRSLHRVVVGRTGRSEALAPLRDRVEGDHALDSGGDQGVQQGLDLALHSASRVVGDRVVVPVGHVEHRQPLRADQRRQLAVDGDADQLAATGVVVVQPGPRHQASVRKQQRQVRRPPRPDRHGLLPHGVDPAQPQGRIRLPAPHDLGDPVGCRLRAVHRTGDDPVR
ncbi:hypothetical protein BG845_06040 [Pseudonocardia autotrophica]|uniref:Uncharacterized protein n=1 Tax=Pseudonocardia autotrophica TaxID=2074 RepID=A0A1Y2MK07_PSEAH|nr:hypothetical protein BG845_06040 [Pseudonocardia autotrophica]